MTTNFKPALIVVDMQEDFCPPNGAIPVPGARALLPTINSLLHLPFAVKVLTQDWHPRTHISFASNHPGSPEPVTSTTTITNPYNASESYETKLWPVHCVQDTPGAQLVQGLEVDRADRVVKKGMDERVEMYSVFYDPLKQPRVSDSGLVGELKGMGISHVFVVGVAAEYCVKSTAVDAAAEGFTTVIVEQGTRPADEEEWKGMKGELEGKGVRIVSLDGEEVRRVKELERK